MFSSRVISDSKMFIEMLRVEIAPDVIWSRLLMLASWPNTKLPPTWGHLNGAADAGIARMHAVTADMAARRSMFSPSDSLCPTRASVVSW